MNMQVAGFATALRKLDEALPPSPLLGERARVRVSFPTLTRFMVLIPLSLGLLTSSSAENSARWEQLMSDAPKAIKLSKNVPQAIQLCEEAITLARTFGSNDTHLSKSQILRAEIYQWEKKYDLAEQTFKLAIVSCENAVGTNDIALVDPLSSLASYYLQATPPRYAEA